MPGPNAESESASSAYRDLFGYLNFSDGAPNARSRACWNQIFREIPKPWTLEGLAQHLLEQLDSVQSEDSGALAESSKARTALQFAFRKVFPHYLTHHADLFFHLNQEVLCQPFFIALMMEATLAALANPQLKSETEQTQAAVAAISNYVGYRPVAVLENCHDFAGSNHAGATRRVRP